MIPPTILVEGITLADTWQKLVKEVMSKGIILPTEYGPKSKDVCSIASVKFSFAEPMLHPSFPTKKDHLVEYIKQFDRNYDWKKQGFTYTYMDRLINYPAEELLDIETGHILCSVDQLHGIRENLKKPITRRAQAITWVPEEDEDNNEPPCLQRIWMRRLNERDVEMHCEWRSRDLFSAWNSNYIAILDMIAREILIPLNLRLVKLVDFVDSLHIYEGNWEEASNIKNVQINPMLMR